MLDELHMILNLLSGQVIIYIKADTAYLAHKFKGIP